MFNKLKLFNQARQMQKKLNDLSVDEEYNGVKITLNGKQEITQIEINSELLDDKGKLESILKEAFNRAIHRSQLEMAKKMQSDFGNLGSLLGS